MTSWQTAKRYWQSQQSGTAVGKLAGADYKMSYFQTNNVVFKKKSGFVYIRGC